VDKNVLLLSSKKLSARSVRSSIETSKLRCFYDLGMDGISGGIMLLLPEFFVNPVLVNVFQMLVIELLICTHRAMREQISIKSMESL
jgi:hypothetical protein